MTCPRYNSYTTLKPELRAKVKEFITQNIANYSVGTKPFIFLEDELAVRLYGNHCDIYTLSMKVDKSVIKLVQYYDMYTDEFLSRYDEKPNLKNPVSTYETLLPTSYKDRDTFIQARRKQYRDCLHDSLSEATRRHKVLLQFVTDNNVNTWVSPLEHELGDGKAIITANINDFTVKCYYGGIYLPEAEMKLILSEII